MRFFDLAVLDMKRLIGNGRIVLLALLVPLIAVVLFGAILIPSLSAEDGISIEYGIVNEDDHEIVGQMINLIANTESIAEYGRAYPISDEKTGIEAVEEGELGLFVHIPEDFYDSLLKERPVTIDVYYSPSYAMQADIILKTVQSCFSIYGQSEVLVSFVGHILEEKGIPENERTAIEDKEYEALIKAQINRGMVLGWEHILSPAGNIKYEYYLGILFAVFSLFAAFPALYLTARDQKELFSVRRLGEGRAVSFYFARLFSGTVLVVVSFLLMVLIAAAFGGGSGRFSPAFLPAVLLSSLCYAALLIFLGLVAGHPDRCLWIAFYVLLFFIVFGILIPDTALPEGAAEILRWLPIRPVMSLLSNTVYSSEMNRAGGDFIRLSVDTGVFILLGAWLYRRKGEDV